MSTILKALRRLEQEKERQAAAERLHGDVMAPSTAAAAGWRRRSGWLMLGLGLVAGLLVALLYSGVPVGPAGRSGPELPEVAAESPPQRSLRRPSSTPAEKPAVSRREVAAGAALSASPASPPDRQTASSPPPGAAMRAESVRAEPPAAKLSVAPASPPPEISAVAVAPPPPRASSAPAPIQKQNREHPEPLIEPATREASARPAPVPAPVKSIRRSVGTEVSVIRTVWHPVAERRVAHLAVGSDQEIVRLHEGDAYSGMVVAEISPSGVTFERGGVRISRRVGEGR